MADLLNAVVIAGPRGPGIFAGAGDPVADFGKESDLYLDLIDGSLWRREPLWEEIASGLFSAGQAASDGSNILVTPFRAALVIDQVNNTSDLNKPVSTAQQAALDAKLNATARGAANGVAPLGADSKIPESYIPAVALVDVFPVASQAAMLALTAQKGDVVVRSDLNKSFMLGGTGAPATLANWIELRTPTDAVLSVAGKTGAVSLEIADVSGLTGALSALAPKAGPTFTGDVGVPTRPTVDSSDNAASTAFVYAVLSAANAQLPLTLGSISWTSNAYTTVAGDRNKLLSAAAGGANKTLTLANPTAIGQRIGAIKTDVTSQGVVTIQSAAPVELAALFTTGDYVAFVSYDGSTWSVERYDIKPVRFFYTAAGTFTKRALLKYIGIEGYGGGGGGGGGRRDSNTLDRTGGDGGTPSLYSYTQVPAARVGATEAVTVGAGGAGGAATASGAVTNNGSAGTASSVGILWRASGGRGGRGGYGGSRATTVIANGLPDVVSSYAGGGGSGGYRNSSDTTTQGTDGGFGSLYTNFISGGAPANGTANGGNGTAATEAMNDTGGGSGGGGGGQNGGNGGNGGFPGGAGGGGGAAQTGSSGGAGGNGADGKVWITMYF